MALKDSPKSSPGRARQRSHVSGINLSSPSRSGFALSIAAAVALLAAGCSRPEPEEKPAPSFATKSAALTAANLQALGQPAPQQIPWSLLEDKALNKPAIINGKIIIPFSRATPGEDKTWYVDCNENLPENCLVAEAIPHQIVGLPEGMGTYTGAAIFQDINGNNKILLKGNNDGAFIMDIGYNANNILEASIVGDLTLLDPSMNPSGNFSFFHINGVPHVIYNAANIVKLRNLHTNAIQNVAGMAPEDISICGGPDFIEAADPANNLAIGAKHSDEGGTVKCKAVQSSTFEGLALNPQYINNLVQALQAQGINKMMAPRIFVGKYLLFMVQLPAAAGGGTKLYYSPIPHCGDGIVNSGETAGTCPQDVIPNCGNGAQDPNETAGNCPADFPVVVPDAGPTDGDVVDPPPDATPVEDVAVPPDATPVEDVAVPPDATPTEDVPVPPEDVPIPPDATPADAGPPPDTTPPEDVAVPPDTTPADAGPPPDATPADTGPQPVCGDSTCEGAENPASCAIDCAPPDPLCVEKIVNKLELVLGDCKMEICPIEGGGTNMEVNGNAGQICKIKIFIDGNPNPAFITVSNDKNGKLKLSCDFTPGYDTLCQPGLNTTAELEELGHKIRFFLEGVIIGSDASHILVTPREDTAEGRIFEVASYNTPEEPLAWVRIPIPGSDEPYTLWIPSDGEMQVVNIDAKTMVPLEETTTTPDGGAETGDAGQEDTGPTESDASNDAEPTTGAETDAKPGNDATGGDATGPEGKSGDSGGGGCKSAPGETPNGATTAALLALVLAGLGIQRARRRKQELEFVRIQPAQPVQPVQRTFRSVRHEVRSVFQREPVSSGKIGPTTRTIPPARDYTRRRI